MRGQNEKTVHVPWELINEILLRLPVKSLVRFKSASKSWFSLISSSHFALTHFELAAARTDRIVFIEPLAPKVLSIDYDAPLDHDSASAVLNCEFMKPCEYVEIIGSCRGFLLFELNDILCVWNPSTGIHQFVKVSPIATFEMLFELCIFLYGFAYDPSTDDLFVVQVFLNLDDHVGRAEYFSLRANASKEIEPPHLCYKECTNFIDHNQAGTFFNAAIHWLAFRFDLSIHVILAFDLVDKTFSDIALPLDFELHTFKFCLLTELAELLSLCTVHQNHSVEIWAMKEYKVQSSWTKTIVVSYHDFPTRYFFPMCSTKNGDIVGTDIITVLMKCNDKGKLQQRRYYGNDPHTSRVAVYTESLFSLPRHSEQAEEDA